MIPLVFEDPKAYEKIDEADELRIENCPEQIKNKTVAVENVTKGIMFSTRLELSEDEIEMLLCGGQLPFIKSKCIL